MRKLQALGGLLAAVAGVLLLRVVLHGYTDHGHVDVFHLLVAAGAVVGGSLLVWRAGTTGRA